MTYDPKSNSLRSAALMLCITPDELASILNVYMEYKKQSAGKTEEFFESLKIEMPE
jgi:hypothetical protein